MNRQIPFLLTGLIISVFGALTVPAQIPVTGITDKTVYQNQARFTVATEPGYTYMAQLDGNRVPVGIEVTVNEPDYHELLVTRSSVSSGAMTNARVRFIVVTSERSCCDNGLPMWVPYPTISSAAAEFAHGHLKLIAPRTYPQGMEIPVVAWVENAEGEAVRANGWLTAAGAPSIRIRRGVGSGFLPEASVAGDLPYSFELGDLQAVKSLEIESSTTWSNVSGTLSGNVTWPENARISVTGNLTIPSGSILTIGAGAVVRLNSLVNIYVDGQVLVNGTTNVPVVFAPANRAQPWGGFALRTASSRIAATGTIFTGSGGDPCFFNSASYRGTNCAPAGALTSHRPEQPLFHCPATATVTLTDCGAIYLAGQFGKSLGGGATFRMDRVLIERCTAGGEYGPGIFMNNCALIEVPNESSNFADGDNDGLYLTTGGNAFTNCLFGWFKDDALDTGGSGSGINHVINCWLEGTFHEGIAGSGTGKYVNLRDTVAMNCGQGFEDGYDRMSNYLDHCLATANATGARFADGYAGGYVYDGFLRVTNSLLLYNYRDVWGMAFNPTGSGWQTNSWVQRVTQMDVRSNYLSAPNINFPNNNVWNPATDGRRLAAFMSTAPGAAVGMGFAVWSNQQDLALLPKGVPVRLSSFTTNFVSVDYTFLNNNGTLASGTLTFAPGETVRRIMPWGFDLAGQSSVTVVLGNPVNAVVTDLGEVVYQGSAPEAGLSLGVTGRQTDLARLGDGLALKLSVAPTLPVVVNYTLEGDGRSLGTGSVTFQPGELYQWITPPGVDLEAYGIVRVTVNGPAGTTMIGTNQIYLVRTPAPPALAPATTLVAAGATWKYIDTGVNLGLAWSPSNPNGWSGTNFNDTAWPSGQAPLGFDYGGVDRTTLGFGPDGNNKYTTYYFRRDINVTNIPDYASLTFRLLRDDGAVVYLNGAEVYRDNMPQGIVITNQTFASTTVSGSPVTYLVTNISLSALSQPLREGTNLLAVEIHQSTLTSSDLIMDLEVLANPLPPSAGRPSLYYGRFDSTNMVLGWGDQTYGLQRATNVGGPYGAAVGLSPVSVSATNQQDYFRLRK